jgi:hypothetical protein
LRNTKTINDPVPRSKRQAERVVRGADSAGAHKVELPEIPKAGSFRPGSEEK